MDSKNQNKMKTNKEELKEKLKNLFILTQEVERLSECEENFISIINEAESELDEEEDFNLLDAEIFLCDCVDARNKNYYNLIDYWEEC